MSASRFKFRAWHDYDGMTDDIVMGRKGFTAIWRGQGGLRIGQEFDAQPEPHKHFAILMQSTGLTDKNGVEIFEGDILKLTLPNGCGWIAPVEWASDRFSGVPIRSDKGAAEYWSGTIAAHQFQDCEVIGNIYENSELLDPFKYKELSISTDVVLSDKDRELLK